MEEFEEILSAFLEQNENMSTLTEYFKRDSEVLNSRQIEGITALHKLKKQCIAVQSKLPKRFSAKVQSFDVFCAEMDALISEMEKEVMQCIPSQPTGDDIPMLVMCLETESTAISIECLEKIDQYLNDRDPAKIQRVYESGIMMHLHELCSSSLPCLQAWALKLMYELCGVEEYALDGDVDIVALIDSDDYQVKRLVVLFIGKYSQTWTEKRSIYWSKTVEKPLLKLLNVNTDFSSLSNALRVIRNLCNQSHMKFESPFLQRLLRKLFILLFIEDEDTLIQIFGILQSLTAFVRISWNESVDVLDAYYEKAKDDQTLHRWTLQQYESMHGLTLPLVIKSEIQSYSALSAVFNKGTTIDIRHRIFNLLEYNKSLKCEILRFVERDAAIEHEQLGLRRSPSLLQFMMDDDDIMLRLKTCFLEMESKIDKEICGLILTRMGKHDTALCIRRILELDLFHYISEIIENNCWMQILHSIYFDVLVGLCSILGSLQPFDCHQHILEIVLDASGPRRAAVKEQWIGKLRSMQSNDACSFGRENSAEWDKLILGIQSL